MPRKKLNCWEFFNCGREKNGLMVELLGECPASTSMKNDGTNDGVGAGRSCWEVCSSDCQVGRSHSVKSCFECPFYIRVQYETEAEPEKVDITQPVETFEVA